jgi:hypothetical protein
MIANIRHHTTYIPTDSVPRHSIFFASMDLSQYFSIRRKEEAHGHHNSSHSTGETRSYLPLLANPINEDVREVLSGSSSDIEKLNTAKRVGTSDTSTLAGSGKTSRGNVIIYKQHHEASTIELFYDLFFVANLGMNATEFLRYSLTSHSLLHRHLSTH